MAGLIPQPFIDDIIQRTDIVEFIDGYVPLKKRGNSHMACCPFHSEKTPSFYVVPKKQFYHCFGCGASGNVISFAMGYLHLDFIQAVETLATRLGMQIQREGHLDNGKSTQSLSQVLARASEYYQNALTQLDNSAMAYLKKRQVNAEMIKLYQLGYAPPGWHTIDTRFKMHRNELITTGVLVQKEDGKTYDRYRDRLIFPIHDKRGHLIGFGGRTLDDVQKPKYLNSPETPLFQKGRELYGLYQVLQFSETPQSILIVEGYLDVIALAQHQIQNGVATLGTATTSYHIQLLSKYTKRLVFCFDGDSAGKQAAWRALENSLPHLNMGLEISFVFLPEEHDPDSLIRKEGREAFLKRIETSLPLHHYFFDTLTREVDTVSLAGKSQLLHLTKPYFLKMGEGPYHQLMLNELARITRIEPHRIQTLTQDTALTKLKPNNHSIARTPARLAVALLLQNPEILKTVSALVDINLLDGEAHPTLKKLVEHLQEHPQSTTAQVIEAWRDTPSFEALTKLAAWDHQVPEDALAKEFVDIVGFFSKQSKESQIQSLLEKARHQPLTDLERLELQEKLKQKHLRPKES